MLAVWLGTEQTQILLSWSLRAGGKQRINKTISEALVSSMLDTHNNDSIEEGIKTASGHLELLMPLSQQVKKGVTVLAGMTGPDGQGKWTAAPQGGGAQDVCSTPDPSGCLLGSPRPVISQRQWKTTTTQSRQDY